MRRAVAIGGGTGLPAGLTALLALGYDTTAVVTMADDGGSSGHLRRELGMLPPDGIIAEPVLVTDANGIRGFCGIRQRQDRRTAQEYGHGFAHRMFSSAIWHRFHKA